MSAKKIILSIISSVIIILILISFVPLSYLLRPVGYNRDNLNGFYAETPNSLDMVYIGGSACFLYWEPLRAWNQYGFTSYNFAHDTIPPQAIKYYIKEIKKTQTPKLWVIDLRPFQYGEEPFAGDMNIPNMSHEVPIRNGVDYMLYSKNRNDLIKASVGDKSERFSYYFDFIKYHSNWQNFGFLLYNCWESKSLKPFGLFTNILDNPSKGFFFQPKTQSVNFTDYSSVKEETVIPARLNELFIDLIDYCTQEKLTVLFIVHSYCQTKEHKMKYNYMKRIIEDNGFEFLNTNDYCKDIGLDYSMDMFNNDHVNVFGAEKYTDFVAKYINKHYYLPDKRNQSAYEEWNTLYVDFESDSTRYKTFIKDLRNQQLQKEVND